LIYGTVVALPQYELHLSCSRAWLKTVFGLPVEFLAGTGPCLGMGDGFGSELLTAGGA